MARAHARGLGLEAHVWVNPPARPHLQALLFLATGAEGGHRFEAQSPLVIGDRDVVLDVGNGPRAPECIESCVDADGIDALFGRKHEGYRPIDEPSQKRRLHLGRGRSDQEAFFAGRAQRGRFP